MESEDLKLIHPFSLIISGPTSSGKSTLLFQILDNLQENTKGTIKKVIFIYGVYQEVYENYPSIYFTDDLNWMDPDVKDESTIIILDDVMSSINNSKNIEELFTRRVQHKKVSVILTLQNLFYRGSVMKTLRDNTTYIALTRHLQDVAKLDAFARQLERKNSTYFRDAYDNAVSGKYGYLFIDNHPHSDLRDGPHKIRYRSLIHKTEGQDLYLPDGRRFVVNSPLSKGRESSKDLLSASFKPIQGKSPVFSTADLPTFNPHQSRYQEKRTDVLPGQNVEKYSEISGCDTSSIFNMPSTSVTCDINYSKPGNCDPENPFKWGGDSDISEVSSDDEDDPREDADQDADQESHTRLFFETPEGLKLLKYVKDLMQTKVKVYELIKTWRCDPQGSTNDGTAFIFKLSTSDTNKMKKLSNFMHRTSDNLYELVKTCDKNLIQTIDALVHYCATTKSSTTRLMDPLFRKSHKDILKKFNDAKTYKTKKVILLKSIRNESFDSFMTTHLNILRAVRCVNTI